MKIHRPLLAEKLENPENLNYPVLCTPKIDGIRCLKIDGKIYTRNFKEFPNEHVRKLLEQMPLDNVDGELVLHDKMEHGHIGTQFSFNECQSALM
ncbi:hypothetical protein RZS08_11875, partial [Arthrospira platensis SPKY1]|nr:hypothetical protein [Arthrospira platensis SPKY1]